MTDPLVEEAREVHHRHGPRGGGSFYCGDCSEEWPCITTRLADRVEGYGRVLADKEWLAAELHRQYEYLAPEYGYKTRRDSAVPWEDVPEPNRSLMLNVAQNVGHAIARQALSTHPTESETG